MWITIALYSVIWLVVTFLLIPWIVGLFKFPPPQPHSASSFSAPPVALILQIIATVIYAVMMYRLIAY